MINGQIGVIGASGFIGNRLTERLVLEKGMKVKAIVRGIASCTRLARFDLPVEFADVLNKDLARKTLKASKLVLGGSGKDATYYANRTMGLGDNEKQRMRISPKRLQDIRNYKIQNPNIFFTNS